MINCQFISKGPIRFCHSARKMKLSKLDSKLKEGILCRLKHHRASSTTDEHLRIFSLCLMPSLNCKSNFDIFVFSWKWQNLIGPYWMLVTRKGFIMLTKMLLSPPQIKFLFLFECYYQDAPKILCYDQLTRDSTEKSIVWYRNWSDWPSQCMLNNSCQGSLNWITHS